MMKVIKGNILDTECKYIMHGCNCFHTMGGGVARAIADKYPYALEADILLTNKGDPGKLGDFSVGYPVNGDPRVINLYTQFKTGADFIPSIFPSAIREVNNCYKGEEIAIPLIGCGIGGGSWEYVQKVLLDSGPDIDWRVYVL